MIRYALRYGLASGAVIIVTLITTITAFPEGGPFRTLWFGYLLMLIALSMIFIGVKRYRDRELGGVIRFGRALLVGLGIALVAALAYVVIWEIYLAMTNYQFMDRYIAGTLEGLRKSGASAEEISRESASLETMRQQYRNPLLRVAMTFVEIFPVGLLVALLSAGLLRNPRLLAARSAA
jgi:hypothetical protein